MQVEAWPPAGPIVVAARSTVQSSSNPPARPDRTSNIIYEEGSGPNPTSPRPAADSAVDLAGRPHSSASAAATRGGVVTADSIAGISCRDPDGVAGSKSSYDTEAQGVHSEHCLQQDVRTETCVPLPVSCKANVVGGGSKQAGAVGNAAAVGEGTGSADGRAAADAIEQQQQQQQQPPESSNRGSPSRVGVANSIASPDMHIGVPFLLAGIDPVEAAAGIEELYLPDRVLHQILRLLQARALQLQGVCTIASSGPLKHPPPCPDLSQGPEL